MKPLYLSLLLVFSAVSCGKSQPEPDAELMSPRATATPEAIGTLNLLAWVGYDERDYLDQLEHALGGRYKIQVKTYVGGDDMYNQFTVAAQGTYDVVVVDAEYGNRLFTEGSILALEEDLWRIDGLLTPFIDGEPARVGGEVYGAIARWGALGLVYNTEYVAPDKVSSYEILWDPSYRNRIGVFDWYLPNMGVLSIYNQFPNPFALDPGQLNIISDQLVNMRSQIRSLHPTTGEVIADLKSGDIWLTFGVGEWAAASLQSQGLPIDWSVPKEGGVMWVECLAIPASARNKAASRELIAAMRTDQLLARLAWRNAYVSQLPTTGAYTHLSADQRRTLHADNIQHLQELASSLTFRRLPGGAPPSTSEADWLAAWARFKSQ